MNEKLFGRITFLLLGVFGFLLFSQAIHLTFHEHRICSQHGEWVDYEGNENLLDSNFERSFDTDKTRSHAHCPSVSTEAQKRWKLVSEQALQLFVLSQEHPETVSHRIIYLTPPLAKAPKTSPPV